MTASQSDSFFFTQKRWQITLSISLGMVIIQGMRCNFPVAKIVMVEMPQFNWTEHEIAYFESSYFYGFGVSQIPAGMLATRFSSSKLLGLSLFMAGSCSILTALAFHFNINSGVIAAQVVQGIGFGLSQPAIHGVLRGWAPPQERSKLTSTAFNGLYLAVLFGSGISASASVIHWSLPFYIYGCLAFLWLILWCFISSPHPRKHRSITETELNYIVSAIGESCDETIKLSEVPWVAMLTSAPVWATVFVNVALNWNIYMFINHQIYYLNSVFGMSTELAGWIVAPSQLLQVAVVSLTAVLSDHLLKSEKCSKKGIRKGFMSLGLLLQAACLVGLGTVAFNSYIAVFLMIMACGSIGTTITAYLVNQFDLSPLFAPMILGMNNAVGGLAGSSNFIIEPLAAQGEEGWKICFLIGAGINVVGALSFLVLGSVDLQPWANRQTGESKPKKVFAVDAETLEDVKKNAEVL